MDVRKGEEFQSSDYCEFILRDRGVDPLPRCTIEVRNTFNQEFGQALMTELPQGAWLYDTAASPRCFRLLPAELERAVEIARRFYGDQVYQNFGEDRAIHGGDESAATAIALSSNRFKQARRPEVKE